VWPSESKAIPANTGWIVLSFNVPVAADDVKKLQLVDGDVRLSARWVMTAADPYVVGAILWGPFSDPRCSNDEQEALCAGHDYDIAASAGVRGENSAIAHSLARLHVGEAALKGPEWMTLGDVQVTDTAAAITRSVDTPCVLRAPELPLAGSEPATIFDMSEGRVLISGLTPETEYTWNIECVDATGRSTAPWQVVFRTGTERRVLLSEVVVDPQHDWNDSQQPRGVPFDADAVLVEKASSTDEWIELVNEGAVSVDLENYSLRTLDASPETQRIGEAFTGKTPQGFSPSALPRLLAGERLVVRATTGSGSVSNAVTIELVDELGVVRDTVTLGKEGVPSGEAKSSGDEAVAACITNGTRAWKKTRATPAAQNACE
jgi:hypothetical protein